MVGRRRGKDSIIHSLSVKRLVLAVLCATTTVFTTSLIDYEYSPFFLRGRASET